MRIPAITSRSIETVYAHLFFLFFVVQILSPSIGEKTIYLEYVVAVLNPFFWMWVKTNHFSRNTLFALLCLAGIACLGHAGTTVKLFVNLFGVVYLSYLWQRHLWRLEIYLTISVLFAVAQISLLPIDPVLAMSIGPGAISQMVWGPYGTATYTNFYAIFDWGLPHVSGLSREAGFMASLIVASFWLFYLRRKHHVRKEPKKRILMYLAGYITSFSKMSFAVFGVWLVHQFRRWIDRIPSIAIICAWLFVFVGYWYTHQEPLLTQEGVTFLSRFGAYASMLGLDVRDFFFGIADLNKIDAATALAEYYGENGFAGFGGWIISNGILAILLWFFALKFFGVTSTGFLMILMLTINVQPDTNQNFVVLAYYIVFQYYRIKIQG